MRNGCENYNQSAAFARVRGCCERGTVRGPWRVSSSQEISRRGSESVLARVVAVAAAANGGPFAVRFRRSASGPPLAACVNAEWV